jgi:hypothetical protein
VHRSRIGAFAAHLQRLVEQPRIEHKIRTLHVYSVSRDARWSRADGESPRC